jgi:hypothetical protein
MLPDYRLLDNRLESVREEGEGRGRGGGGRKRRRGEGRGREKGKVGKEGVA